MGPRGSRRPRTSGMRDGAAIRANRRTARRESPVACVRSVGGCVCWCGDTAPPLESRARYQKRLPMGLVCMDLRSFTQSITGNTRLHWAVLLFRRRGRSSARATAVQSQGAASRPTCPRLVRISPGRALLHGFTAVRGSEVGGLRGIFREAASARTPLSPHGMQASRPSPTPARRRPLGGARVANHNPFYVAPVAALPQNSIKWQWRGRAAAGEGELLWTITLRRQLDSTGRQRHAGAPAAAAHRVVFTFCLSIDTCSRY